MQIRGICISLGGKYSSHFWTGPGPGRAAKDGAPADMGETAEFEKLYMLEARLAAALDRIAMGMGAVLAEAPFEDPGITSGAFEDVLARAQTAEARLAELQAELASAVPQAAPGADMAALESELAALRTQLRAAESARQADRDEAARTLAGREAEIARLTEALAQAQAQTAAHPGPAAAEAEAEVEALKTRVEDLEARHARLRAERAEAIAERDEARDIAEELQAAAGHHPEDRAMALRAEIKELQHINERLIKNINRLRGENATDPGVLNKSLVVELDALRALRASEAAELDRILADLDRADAGEGTNA